MPTYPCPICGHNLQPVPESFGPICEFCNWPRNNILAFVWPDRDGKRIDP